jgi:TRAP-type C4-dicarboxylate transport system permease small subunit
VFLAVGALIIYQANDSIRQFTHHSQIAELPMDVLHAVIPASFALMVVLVVMHGIAGLREAADESSRTVRR